MTPELIDRLAKIIPLLGSDKDFEALGAARAIGRALVSEKLDFHDLARRLCSGQQQSTSAPSSDASGFNAWAADFVRRDAERKRRDEAERAAEAERFAAEMDALAAKAAARSTPEAKAQAAQRRRDALDRKKAREAAAEAERARAEAEAERLKADRIAAEGPRWGDITEPGRRAWASRILDDPAAPLDPATKAALEAIEAALAPPLTRAMRRGRPQKPPPKITGEWIAAFEQAARGYALRKWEARP